MCQCCIEVHMKMKQLVYTTFIRYILICVSLSLIFLVINVCSHKHIHILMTDLISMLHSIKCTVFPLFPSSAYSICLDLLKPSLCSHQSSLLLFFSFLLHSLPITFRPLEFGTCNSCKKYDKSTQSYLSYFVLTF